MAHIVKFINVKIKKNPKESTPVMLIRLHVIIHYKGLSDLKKVEKALV